MNTRLDITNSLPRAVADTGAAKGTGLDRSEAPVDNAARDSAARPAQDSVRVGAPDIAELARQGDGIDNAKVERLRAAIADGSYRVDAEKLAEKLIAFEAGLDGVRK
ncbi:MAG: flagellar biosynthesis anti-sigma factor FlgM [Oceanococcaceae bacterium]